MQTAIRHTISQEPGSVMEFNGTPDAKRLETSTAGLSTYQAAKGMAKGAIQSIAGTTDTRSNAENSLDPGMGKTPQALKMIAEREGTRDNFDRGLLERAMAELIDGMFSILPTITEEIPVDMFSKEIEEIIQSGHTDLAEIFKHWKNTGLAEYRMSESGNQMRIKIKPSAFKGIRGKFELKANSTAKQTREQQLQAMELFWELIGKLPNALDQYQQQTGKVPDWEYIFGEMGKMMDLPFMSKMFTNAQTQPAAPVADTSGQEPTVPGAGNPMPPTGATPPPPTGVEGAAPPQNPGLVMPPEGQQMPPQMPMGMNPAQPPTPQPMQPNPEFLQIIQQASPETPVRVGNYQFTDPSLALQAYEMLLEAGVA